MNSLQHKNGLASKPLMSLSKVQPTVQAKLTINEPGDQYEQEADAMAERVMRMSSNENEVKPKTGLIGASIQRKGAASEDDGKWPIMRKVRNGSTGVQASPSFVSSLNASKGGGVPLPQGTRSFMENAFNADFSGVRVHTGSKASEMSKGINARAFTVGNNIFFKNGNYNPETLQGRQLLAHELVHTKQQENGIQRMIMRTPDTDLDELREDYKKKYRRKKETEIKDKLNNELTRLFKSDKEEEKARNKEADTPLFSEKMKEEKTKRDNASKKIKHFENKIEDNKKKYEDKLKKNKKKQEILTEFKAEKDTKKSNKKSGEKNKFKNRWKHFKHWFSILFSMPMQSLSEKLKENKIKMLNEEITENEPGKVKQTISDNKKPLWPFFENFHFGQKEPIALRKIQWYYQKLDFQEKIFNENNDKIKAQVESLLTPEELKDVKDYSISLQDVESEKNDANKTDADRTTELQKNVFYEVFPDKKPEDPPVEAIFDGHSKAVSIVKAINSGENMQKDPLATSDVAILLYYYLEVGTLTVTEKSSLIDLMDKYSGNPEYINSIFGDGEGQFLPDTYISKMTDSGWLDKELIADIRKDAKANRRKLGSDLLKIVPFKKTDSPRSYIKQLHTQHLNVWKDFTSSPMFTLSKKEKKHLKFIGYLNEMVNAKDVNDQIKKDKSEHLLNTEKEKTDPIKTDYKSYESYLRNLRSAANEKQLKIDIPLTVNFNTNPSSLISIYINALKLKKTLDDSGVSEWDKQKAAFEFYSWMCKEHKWAAIDFYRSYTLTSTEFIYRYYPDDIFLLFPADFKNGATLITPQKTLNKLKDIVIKGTEKELGIDLLQNYLEKVYGDNLKKKITPLGIIIGGAGLGVGLGVAGYNDLKKGTDLFGFKSGNLALFDNLNYIKYEKTLNFLNNTYNQGNIKQTKKLEWKNTFKKDNNYLGLSQANEYFKTPTPVASNQPAYYQNFNPNLLSETGKNAIPNVAFNTTVNGSFSESEKNNITNKDETQKKFSFNAYAKANLVLQNRSNMTVTPSNPLNLNQSELPELAQLIKDPSKIKINGIKLNELETKKNADSQLSKMPTENILNIGTGASVDTTHAKYFSANASYDFQKYAAFNNPFNVHRFKGGANISDLPIGLKGDKGFKLSSGANFENIFTKDLSSSSALSNIGTGTYTLQIKADNTYFSASIIDNLNKKGIYSSWDVQTGYKFYLDKKHLLGMLDLSLRYQQLPATEKIQMMRMLYLTLKWKL